MTSDLSTQLERYVAAVAADQEEISVAEVQPPVPVVGERSSPPSRDRHGVGRGVVAAVAAAVALLVLVGSVAWLTRSDDTVEPARPTTTLAPPETTSSTLIPAPPPESLKMRQFVPQAEFLDAFRGRGVWSGGQCRRPKGGPSECTVQIDSPTLGGPATRTFTVSGGKQTAFMGDAVREVAEEGLAALYTWALETYPDETAARCGVGFEGDRTAVAWSPGYAATRTCGEHLAGLLFEFNPAEAPEPLETPDPTAGLWSHVETETPEGVPRLGGLFDVAETPVGLLATGVDGLWISQDAVEWQPHARDSVEPEEGSFSNIAVSDLGIVVSSPSGEVSSPSGGGPPHAWFSPDGEQWTAIEGLRIKLSRARTLTASNERFLAIDEDGRVVSSTDGTTWRTVEDLPGGGFGLVAVTPFGFYAETSDGIWRSLDGVEWTQLPTTSIDGQVTSIAGTQTDLVAVTTAPTEDLPDWSTFESRFWHSTDGAMWTEVHVPPQGGPGCTRVGASDSGFLVATALLDPSDSTYGIPAAWFSEDGTRWARVPTGPGDDHSEPIEWPACMNELIPYRDGFLGVNDMGGGPVWRYER